MARFIVSTDAKEDLAEIRAYLRKHSPSSVKPVLTRLRERFRKLAEAPGIGHRREDLCADPMLFWAEYSYLVIYEVTNEGIAIARVLHAARDVEAILAGSEF